MKALEKLASSSGRRDEVPNQELAMEIIKKSDQDAIKELIENLANKSKDIQNDCIKVLYEIGEKDPKLIAPYHADFVKLLDNKNNRLQWGGMEALNTIALEKPDIVFKSLSKLIEVAEKGSVITKDGLMS